MRACLGCAAPIERRTRCDACRKLWTRYKLTPLDVDALRASQNDACAICGTTTARRWVVDHSHACCAGDRSCGACIRGVLCDACNLAIGHLGDDANRALSAARYLSRTSTPTTRVNGRTSIL